MALQLGVVTSLPEDLSWISSIHTTHDYLQLLFQRLQGPFLGTLWAPGTQMLHIIYIQANAHTNKNTYVFLNIVYFWQQFRLVHKRIEWRLQRGPIHHKPRQAQPHHREELQQETAHHWIQLVPHQRSGLRANLVCRFVLSCLFAFVFSRQSFCR